VCKRIERYVDRVQEDSWQELPWARVGNEIGESAIVPYSVMEIECFVQQVDQGRQAIEAKYV
jgi:hypothetical protein